MQKLQISSPIPLSAFAQRLQRGIEQFSTLLNQGQRLSQDTVVALMNEICGATAAQGGWNWKEAYNLIEAAFVRVLLDNPNFQEFDGLQGLVPHQTVRSEQQIELQQFSTPLALANIAAIAAQITAEDSVLEPSAGTGILAGFAGRITRNLILNEICPERSAILGQLFPHLPIYNYNGEQIDDFLEQSTSIQPTVVLMNPPFSSSPNMAKRNRQAVFSHIRSAIDRLADAGRLVAIAPHWFNPEMCHSFTKYPAQLLLSAYIPGKVYRYHATTMETRLLVFDKIENSGPVPSINTSFEELLDIVRALPLRQPMPVATNITPAPTIPKIVVSSDAKENRRTPTETQLILVPPPASLRVTQAKSVAVIPINGFAGAVLLVYKAAEVITDSTDSEGIYEPYKSSSIEIQGAIEHPTPLVESMAMATVRMPVPTYQPLLPANLVQQGILSHAQLEAIVFAGEAHSQMLAAHWDFDPETKRISKVGVKDGTQYRRGFWVGDGTGVGKGREASGIFCDNWMQGRRKGLWLSKNPTLLEDARRDWQSLGGNPDQIVPIGKYKQGDTIALTEGILFVPYGTLRVGAKQGKQSRLDQIINWLGEDFDGCICFDEAHMMGNAMGEEGSRGKKAASQQGLAGLELQNRLPSARITYISATGASKVSNLAYASRLGLWQTDNFPFDSREGFVFKMECSGIAAMEVVIRDLKSLGLYMARALSYDGIAYETMVHNLTPEQVEIYGTYAKAFQVIHQNIDAALIATNAVSQGGKCRNSNSKSAARSAFEGTKQRFFNHLVTAAKFPTVVNALEADLQAGHAPILQIVATDEALLERRLAEIPSNQWNDLRLDFTPKEAIIDYLMHSFPVQLQDVYTDAEGRECSQLVTDGLGNPILCKAAVAMRERLIEDIALLPSVAGFLDQLIWHFGTDVVAEVTGRSKRVVLKDGKYQLESRSANANIAETQAFQNDRKKILVFSAAGATGRSYHADLKATNQRLRRHYLIQSGWEASNAVQSLGRSHRSSQKQPPVFILTTTNVKGEVRFTATIASRLASLGALTRGQRQTGSQGIYNEEVSNLTSDYAKATLIDFFQKLYRVGIAGYSIGEFSEITGLNLLCQEGGLRDDLPAINTFLNRLLALAIEDQNQLFGVFEEMLATRIQAAKDGGHFEVGVERLVADGGFNILSQQVLATHPGGSATICYEIERLTRPRVLTTAKAREMREQQPETTGCIVHNLGQVALLRVWGERTSRDGNVIAQSELITPSGVDKIDDYKLAKLGWSHTKPTDDFWQRWEREVAEIPEYLSSKLYLICGLLLPIWDKLPDDRSKVHRLQANDGTVLLGRSASPKELQKIYANFGVDAPELSISQIYEAIWNEHQVVAVGSWKLRRSYWKGDDYLEVLVSGRERVEYLKSLGCLTEMVKFTMRVYVPRNDQMMDVLERLKGS
jgi:predicted RNA methylase